MAAREDPADVARGARGARLARGVALVLGPILGCVVLPIVSCSTFWPPIETLCTDAGGSYATPTFAEGYVCEMPSPSDPCPPGFEREPGEAHCSTTTLTGRACALPRAFR